MAGGRPAGQAVGKRASAPGKRGAPDPPGQPVQRMQTRQSLRVGDRKRALFGVALSGAHSTDMLPTITLDSEYALLNKWVVLGIEGNRRQHVGAVGYT